MKKIKLISILLAGMIITIDSVRAGAEGKKEVKICYKVGKEKGKYEQYKQNKAIDKEDKNFFLKNSLKDLRKKNNDDEVTIAELDEIELEGKVGDLINKIETEINSDYSEKYQVLAVQRFSPLPTLLDKNLLLSNCSFLNNECLNIYLVLKSDENSFLTPKIGSRGWQYPRIYSFCLMTIFIFLIGGICLYHNPSTLKGEELERKSSWKCRWKVINAMRLSRMLFFFFTVIIAFFKSLQIPYLALFGGYYYYLSDLIISLLFLFLLKLRLNDAKLSKWWLLPGVVFIIYDLISAFFFLKPQSSIVNTKKFILTVTLICILFSPSIPDEKEKAMKEEEEEDDAFINSATDIVNLAVEDRR